MPVRATKDDGSIVEFSASVDWIHPLKSYWNQAHLAHGVATNRLDALGGADFVSRLVVGGTIGIDTIRAPWGSADRVP